MTNDELKPQEILNTENKSLSALPNLLSDNNMAPEDIFATMHYTYAPMVLNSLPKLSKKELMRIVEVITEVPPDQKTINRFNTAQKNVYFTLEKVLMSKYFMMYQVALDSEMRKEAEKQAAKLKEEHGPVVDSSDIGQSDSEPKE